VADRGNQSYIETFPGQPLDSKYSGNVVDLCPVGALTSTDFRFRSRVWFMSSARSICTGCSRGCNIHLDHLNDTTYRYRPRENEAVNQEWMCDDGRLSYKSLNRGRVLSARAGKDAPASPVEVAIDRAAALLSEQAKNGTLAVLVSPVASLEDQMAALSVAKDGLGVGEVYVGGRPDGWKDELLKRADENPNRSGLELAARAFGVELRPFQGLLDAAAEGRVKALWAVGTELPVEGAAERLSGLAIVAQAVNDGPLAQAAEVLLPAAPHSEADGTFVNFEGRAQRFERAYPPRGQARPHFALAGELGRVLGIAFDHASARELFQSLGARLGGALGDYRFDSLPPRRPGSPTSQAGTVDGRLAGFRDLSPSSGEGPPALLAMSEGGRP
jgi:NADH-quinone oxidoreductase subunit G